MFIINKLSGRPAGYIIDVCNKSLFGMFWNFVTLPVNLNIGIFFPPHMYFCTLKTMVKSEFFKKSLVFELPI